MQRAIQAIAIVFALLLGFAPPAASYDQKVVHNRMSRIAFINAETNAKFLGRLQLDPISKFGSSTVEGWVAQGAEDEDEGARSLNHFYDPLHESPLVVMKPVDGCIPIPALSGDFTARQWALITPTNTFGIAAARQQLVGLITAPSADARKQHGIEFFQSLGHIIHLIQDMAQPQHTRNDAHPTSDEKTFDFEDPDPQAFLDKLNLWSRYERWCKQHLDIDQNPSSTSFYTGYPIVKLPSNGAFFKAGDGRGLAEYANRNFVTEHTNYSDLECAPFYFDEPSLIKAIPRQETHHVDTTVWNEETQTLTVKSATYDDIVYSYPVYDAYTGSTNVDQNHAFRSYYDYELNKVQKDPVFSLPESALASKANLLVQRAVGYSAGFLVHFFRGSVAATWAKNADGSYNLTLKNTSAEPLSRIRLTALYRVTPGTHGAGAGEDLLPILSQDLDPAFVLPPNGSTSFSNIAVAGLQQSENLKTFERRIAVVGTLGSEPDVVIGLVQPADPISIVVDCWSGDENSCPVDSAIGIHSWFDGARWVYTDYERFPLGPVQTQCVFKDPLPAGARITRIDAILGVASTWSYTPIVVNATINGAPFAEARRYWPGMGAGTGYVGQGCNTAYNPHVFHFEAVRTTTGVLSGDLPGYAHGADNTLTVTLNPEGTSYLDFLGRGYLMYLPFEGVRLTFSYVKP